MAFVVKDRVKVTTTTTGTGTLTLGAAAGISFQDFSVIGDGNTTSYTIVDPSTGAFEVGIGTYTASGTTLSRDVVLESSNSGSLVNFAAGLKEVFVVYSAEKAVFTDVAQTLTNKTLTNPTINGFTGDTSVINIGSGQFEKSETGVISMSYGSLKVGTTDATFGVLDLQTSATGTAFIRFQDADTNVGTIEYSHTDNQMTFRVNDADRVVINSAGNVGIGTSSPATALDVAGDVFASGVIRNTAGGSAAQPSIQPGPDNDTGMFWPSSNTISFTTAGVVRLTLSSTGLVSTLPFDAPDGSDGAPAFTFSGDTDTGMFRAATNAIGFSTAGTERMRIDAAGDVVIGSTLTEDQPGSGNNTVAIAANVNGQFFVSSASTPGFFNRTADGALVSFQSAGSGEGSISVSGTTVSYNGGHLSRWAQTLTAKDTSLVKGTVLSNLDEMNVYTDAEGNPVDNEQLNKVKVSDVEGDANVAGVFVNWDYDEAHNVDEINMAMTGDMIIRIAQGVTVARGDLLMSAGDGTAKPQGDDIVRSKTIAKVTSTHVTCTYADGSFCVPCVLMAC
jgi:hypothetical protein